MSVSESYGCKNVIIVSYHHSWACMETENIIIQIVQADSRLGVRMNDLARCGLRDTENLNAGNSIFLCRFVFLMDIDTYSRRS